MLFYLLHSKLQKNLIGDDIIFYMQKFYIVMFFLAIFIFFLIWLFLVRESKVIHGTAYITEKIYKEPSVYSRSNAGINRSFQSNTNINIAESYVLVLKIENEQKETAYGLNTILAEKYSVGQKVKVLYTKQGLPFIWQIIRVKSIED